MSNKTYCLYVHTNIVNGKQYCGITSQKPYNRWRKDGSGYNHNSRFQHAISKYGWGAFSHEVIHQGMTLDEANKAEREYIEKHKLIDPKFGYNQTLGGDGAFGYKHSNITKNKMSKSRMGHETTVDTRRLISFANQGELNGMFGKIPWNKDIHCSQETKDKISQSRIGKTSGSNHPMFGKHHTKETKEKMSASQKGRISWNKGVSTGIRPANARRVGQYNDYDELLHIFKSIKEAALFVNGHGSNISKCCKGEVKHASGYVWRYAE